MSTEYEFYYGEIWNNVISEFKKLNPRLSQDVLDILCSCSILELQSSIAKIRYDQYIQREFLASMHKELSDILTNILNRPITIMPIEVKVKSPNDDQFFDSLFNNSLKKEYTFTNFVIGKCNIEVQTAAINVATNPGFLYNPLFIYGKSGLGKTHILNAIGNTIINSTQYRNYKVGIISSTKFVEAVSKCYQDNTLDKLKESMYKLNILLIDDIQFIAGKEKTHEIFFNIFNELISNNKQIVLTADTEPKLIKGLEKRLVSRFNSGLKIQITSLDHDTALKILNVKIRNKLNDQYSIDYDALQFLVSHFSEDVRELEGALNRLLFYSITFPNPDSNKITLTECLECFKNETKNPNDEITIKKIKKIICEYYRISKTELEGIGRSKKVVTARQFAMFFSRRYIDISYSKLGKEFGNRDHTTVMNACTKIEKLINKDKLYDSAYHELDSILNPQKLSPVYHS